MHIFSRTPEGKLYDTKDMLAIGKLPSKQHLFTQIAVYVCIYICIYICTDIYVHVNTRGQALRHEWHVSHWQAALKARSLRPDCWRRPSSASFSESSMSFFESPLLFLSLLHLFPDSSQVISCMYAFHISTYILQFFFGFILKYMYGSRMCNNIHSKQWLFSWSHLHCHFISKYMYSVCMYVHSMYTACEYAYVYIPSIVCSFEYLHTYISHILYIHVHE